MIINSNLYLHAFLTYLVKDRQSFPFKYSSNSCFFLKSNFSTKTINFTFKPEWVLNEQNDTYSQSRVDGHQGPGRVYQY